MLSEMNGVTGWLWLHVAHMAATWLLVGLIWVIQLVHYPLFACVTGAAWQAYHPRHASSITFIVAPAMLVELLCAGSICYVMGGRGLSLISAALVVLVWLVTFVVMVPLHGRLCAASLAEEDRLVLVRRLVALNWVRTIIWSARGVVAALLLVAAAGA